MKINEQQYAVQKLEAWYKINIDYFKRKCSLVKLDNSHSGSVVVDLDTNKYVTQLVAWDHASCLDIEIINLESEETSFPTTGPYDTNIIFCNHLNIYLEWFKREHTSIA